MVIDSFSSSPSINSPVAVEPKTAILFSLRILPTSSRLSFNDKKTTAKVGLKPSVILSVKANLISSGELPFIDFAFILIF